MVPTGRSVLSGSFLIVVEPGPEFPSPLQKEVLHITALQDQEPLFIGVLGEQGIEHLVRSLFHQDIHLDDASVQVVDTLQAYEGIGYDQDRERHERHVSEQHLARDVQARKKRGRDEPVQDTGCDRMIDCR